MRRIEKILLALAIYAAVTAAMGFLRAGYAAEEAARPEPGNTADVLKEATTGTTAQGDKALPPGVKKFAVQENLFTVEVEGASVQNIMKLLSEASGVQIEVMEGVKGKATAGVEGADLENTVRLVLQAAGEANWAREYTHFEGMEGGDRLTRIAVLPKAERKEVKIFDEDEYQPPPFPNELGYEAIEVPVRHPTYVAFKGADGEKFKVIDISYRSDKHEIRSVEDIEKLDTLFLDAVEKVLLTDVIKQIQYPVNFEKRSGSGQNPVVSADGNFVVIGQYENHYAGINYPNGERNIIGDGAIVKKDLTTIYDASGSEIIHFRELNSEEFAQVQSREPADYRNVYCTGISSTGKYYYFIPIRTGDAKTYLIFDMNGKKVLELTGSRSSYVKFSYDDDYIIIFDTTNKGSWPISIYGLRQSAGYVKTDGALYFDSTLGVERYDVADVNESERTMIMYKKARYWQEKLIEKAEAMKLSY